MDPFPPAVRDDEADEDETKPDAEAAEVPEETTAGETTDEAAHACDPDSPVPCRFH